MTNSDAVKVGHKVRQLRKKLHLTQVELAAKVDVQPNTIARIERGVHMPNTETLKSLASALDVSMETLLS